MMPPLSQAECVTLACILEATAPKPGNVHRGADFEDLTFTDFAVSAVVVGPIVAEARRHGIGATILEGVRATRAHVGTNTNLGMLLLLTPLAAVPRDETWKQGVATVLRQLTPDDARDVYAAINLAACRSLGQVEQLDLAAEPPQDLLAAMRLAAERDLVARQYATDFATVLDQVVPWLLEGLGQSWSLTDTIIHTHLRLLAAEPDSLIRRKCGHGLAAEASRRAGLVLDAGQPDEVPFREALADFDFWLRCDGDRRNPGTTADLLAAGLFAILRDGKIPSSYR